MNRVFKIRTLATYVSVMAVCRPVMADQQIAYATIIADNSAWRDESEATGHGDADCNSGGAAGQYAYLTSQTDTTPLIATGFHIQIPSGHRIRVRFNVQVRYNQGSKAKVRVRVYVPGVTGVYELLVSAPAGPDCEWIIEAPDNDITFLADWTPELLNRIHISISRPQANQAGWLRVKAFRLVIDAEQLPPSDDTDDPADEEPTDCPCPLEADGYCCDPVACAADPDCANDVNEIQGVLNEAEDRANSTSAGKYLPCGAGVIGTFVLGVPGLLGWAGFSRRRPEFQKTGTGSRLKLGD